jgi:hypothetical protein
MSNLLEQAIIDATALKEVAMKNAEAALVEKYSKEFKETVEKLLEQEELGANAPSAQPQPEAVPAMPDMQGMADGIEQQEEPFGDTEIPSSFIDEDEDELVTINFDKIKSQVRNMLGMGSEEESGLEPPEMQTQAAPEEQAPILEEEFEIDEELIDEAQDDPRGTDALDEEDEGNDDDGLEDDDLEEQLSFTDEELEQLEEKVKVDIKVGNLSDGHMGTTETQEKEQRSLEFALARDDEETELRKQEEEAMADLKEKLEESQKQNEKLEITVDEFKKVLLSLKEHTEKLSISNAKLLYTNKILMDVSLNERQKNQIVESISKSESVSEAKTIYGALQSTVQGASEKKSKESLSEALIRGSSTPFLVRQQKQTRTDDVFSERMKILAGIKEK